MKNLPRILLADDHAMLLAAFEQLLAPLCRVVGSVADGRALMEAAPRLKPDVIVLDISMPLLNGVDVCRKLKPELPATKWVFLTVNEDADLALEAFRAGASGFLLKRSAASELFSAVKVVMEGGLYVTPLLTDGMPLSLFLGRKSETPADELTSRQREVVQLLAEGRPMKEVGDLLGLSPRTVAFHKYAVMEQLGIKTTAELVQYAIKQRIIHPS